MNHKNKKRECKLNNYRKKYKNNKRSKQLELNKSNENEE